MSRQSPQWIVMLSSLIGPQGWTISGFARLAALLAHHLADSCGEKFSVL